MDELKSGTRGQEETSQASDQVLISMWEVATHMIGDRAMSGVRTLQKGEEDGLGNERRPPGRNSGTHLECRL